MYIVEVLPLGRGIAHDPLSYFSHTDYSRGAILEIPVRKKSMPGIVFSCEEALSMKSALRAATFSLRKLPEQTNVGAVPLALMKTAERVAQNHGIGIGLAFSSMLPKEVREGLVPYRAFADDEGKIPPPDSKPRILVGPAHKRYEEYARLVRESFASGRSIEFVVPTIEHTSVFASLLSPGIEEYTVILNSSRGIKALRSAYGRLATEMHPLLIIATPQYGATARADIGSFVLEHERGSGYHGKLRPYLDFRFMLSVYAEEIGATVILADQVPRAEEIEAVRSGQAIALQEIPSRLELKSQLTIITQEPDSDGTTPFRLFSKKLDRAIEQALKSKKHIFLFAARRGLAPLVACIDCGHIFRDPESGAPLSLIRTKKGEVEERQLVSSVSGYRTVAPNTCPQCGGWRLRERGIGIQHVYDELTRKYDPRFVTLMDHQSASTHKKASILRDAFYGGPGGIMLGTALALPYLTLPVDISAIVSMDSLRAIPSWRQEEEAMSILMSLREKTTGTVYVQTRADPEDQLFVFAKRGAIGDFYTEELAARQSFRYPPYVRFIHLAWREVGTPESSPVRTMIGELFAPYGISIYSAPHRDQKGGIGYGLLRVPREEWPNADIIARLATLPPSVRVMLDPDRII